MLNLAALRYRQIFTDQGGPIEKIEFSEFTVLGQRCFQANAFLSSQLRKARPVGDVYSNAEGTGTHPTALVARYMAISEALERWAFHAKVRDFDCEVYAFDRDASTNGMAAFPGLFPRQARASAWLEALERFCLVSWWDRRLPGRVRPALWPGISAVEITHPGLRGTVVILFKECEGGFYSYGHAAGRNFERACRKAAIELARNEWVLRLHRTTHPDFTFASVPDVRDLFERRCLYFSFPEGHAIFQQRLQSEETAAPTPPKALFDGPIIGPWSRYATVWRVALALPTDAYLDPNGYFFFW